MGFIWRNWIDESGLCDLPVELEMYLLSPLENVISRRNWIWHDGIIRVLLVIYVWVDAEMILLMENLLGVWRNTLIGESVLLEAAK